MVEGDFAKVKDSLIANSFLYKAQKLLVQNLYSRGIKEEIKRIEYLHIKRIKDRRFEVTTMEPILVEDEKGERLRNHKWTYTVIWDKTNHEFYLTKIKKLARLAKGKHQYLIRKDWLFLLGIAKKDN